MFKLFGKKPGTTIALEQPSPAEQVTLLPTVLPIKTLDIPQTKTAILQSTYIPIEELTRHRNKLAKITGRYDYAVPSLDLISKLKDSDIVWMVDGNKLVSKFKYHACIFTTAETVLHAPYCCVRNRDYSNSAGDCYYGGDIPDFALDRIKVAKELGLGFFTIHSNEPLPLKFVISDPVVIGWKYDPLIVYDKLDKSDSYEWHCNESSIGFVIALWNKTGDIETL